jgi:hypothetical protein
MEKRMGILERKEFMGGDSDIFKENEVQSDPDHLMLSQPATSSKQQTLPKMPSNLSSSGHQQRHRVLELSPHLSTSNQTLVRIIKVKRSAEAFMDWHVLNFINTLVFMLLVASGMWM